MNASIFLSYLLFLIPLYTLLSFREDILIFCMQTTSVVYYFSVLYIALLLRALSYASLTFLTTRKFPSITIGIKEESELMFNYKRIFIYSLNPMTRAETDVCTNNYVIHSVFLSSSLLFQFMFVNYFLKNNMIIYGISLFLAESSRSNRIIYRVYKSMLNREIY